MAAEVAWLRSYVTILQARYGDELTVAWSIDPRAEERRLPRLILQPLVENAVLRGIAAALPGRLSISFALDGAGALSVRVANTGSPVGPDVVREGHGLALVKRRLALEAAAAATTLTLGPDAAGGTLAELRIPAA